MPRPNAPFYRRQKNAWYARIDGRVLSLGVVGRHARKAALERYAQLLVRPPSSAPPPGETSVPTVRSLTDAFLADAALRVSPGCLRNYRIFLVPFAAEYGTRPADALAPADVEGFARRPDWSDTYRANFLGCVATVYRWAVRHRRLASDPLPHLHRPPKASRGASAAVGDDEHARLVEHADPLMRDFLTVLWGTGARPGEVAGLTAEMVDDARDGVIPLKAHKTAHRGKARILVLTGEALATARRRAAEVRSGLLFRGWNGRLTAQAIGRRLARLCARAGVRTAIAYGYRHGWATSALARGVPDATVAALLGHSGTGMLHRHYSHLTSAARVLREAAERVRPGAAPSDRHDPRKAASDRPGMSSGCVAQQRAVFSDRVQIDSPAP